MSEEKQIKVIDKRMFTADGELREEYRFLSEKSTEAVPEAVSTTEPAPAPSEAPARPQAAAPSAVDPFNPRSFDPGGLDRGPFGAGAFDDEGFDEPRGTPPLELPGTPEGYDPSFFDLVSMLAEPIPLYLGDIDLPDGQNVENLEMARLHIDLIDVLRQKTIGNLTAQESAFLEDLLYRMRVRYVQKTR